MLERWRSSAPWFESYRLAIRKRTLGPDLCRPVITYRRTTHEKGYHAHMHSPQRYPD
ncbi:hypothetical protein BDD12DRAFT_827241 [Trichophaea hybrida]|nr:hypothetical protein BDD12DRAFT_827241 [Trichophaea hybrida]